MICVGQSANLNFTDTEDTDLTALNLSVFYWSPGMDYCQEPLGEIDSGDITFPTNPVMDIFVEKGILNVPSELGKPWKFRIEDDDTGRCWTKMEFEVVC